MGAPGQLRGVAGDAAVSKAAPHIPAPRSGSGGGSGRGSALWSRYLLLVPSGVAALLGKWQLDRRRWKLNLLERREAQLQGAALDLFSTTETPEEYAHVAATGEFDHDATMYIGPRPRTVMGNTKMGYLVVTPLYNKKLRRVALVSRGWVPEGWRHSAEQREAGQPRGQVEVVGVVRHGETANTFVPENEPARGAWYYTSPSQLAAAAGLPTDTPYIEVLTDELEPVVTSQRMPTTMDVLEGRALVGKTQERYPLPKSAGDLRCFAVMPRDHANYAATWLTLSTATGLLAVKAIRQAGRRRP